MTLTDREAAPAWSGALPSADPTGVPAGLGPGLTAHDGDPWTTAMVDALPRGYRYELLDGVLVVIPMPGLAHQEVLADLLGVLRAATPPELRALPAGYRVYLRQHPLERWLEPDILVARRGDLEGDGMRVPPLLVVEVRSPSTGFYDRTAKSAAYAEFGVPHLWLIDPEARRLTTHTLRARAAGGEPAYEPTARLDVPEPIPADWAPVAAVLATLAALPTDGG